MTRPISRRAEKHCKEADAIEAQNKSQSPLLRLPGEVRNRIYDYVFNSPYTHASLPLSPRRPIHIKRRYCTTRGRFILYQPDGATGVSQATQGCETSRSRTFSLLFVCRQVHTETALLPYQWFIFRIDFDHIWTFVRQTSQRAKSAITGIQISRFDTCEQNFHARMRALAEMTGLQSIVLEQDGFGSGVQAGRLEGHMERMMGRKMQVSVVLSERVGDDRGLFWDPFG